MRLLITLLLLNWTTQSFSQTKSHSGIFGTPTIELPSIDSITIMEKSDIHRLTQDEWTKLNFDKIEDFKPEFEYSIIGQGSINNLILLHVERRFIEENYHWLCMMDQDYKLIDWIETAYDNSEGFLVKMTQIEREHLVITEWNDFENVKQKKIEYQITEHGFKKIKPAHNNGEHP